VEYLALAHIQLYVRLHCVYVLQGDELNSMARANRYSEVPHENSPLNRDITNSMYRCGYPENTKRSIFEMFSWVRTFAYIIHVPILKTMSIKEHLM
jgi:hypothetical protein